MELVYSSWPWWFSGALIAMIMFFLLYFGKSFGFSSNFRTICAIPKFSRRIELFNFNWKNQIWNLLFLVGSIIGGWITKRFLMKGETVEISASTKSDLSQLGFSDFSQLQPSELFSISSIFDIKNFLLLALGGFLVGFGTRYAGGCTSGHAISGLSNLQIPSLTAVVGFFIGGLIMTHLIFPLIF
ncbi:MAG: hypothetical protein RL264_2515 [Bacteroidota bacterium]|jgi:uncharacterized membrane protein YedE/YeeE